MKSEDPSAQRQSEAERRQQIIEYWNAERLCSLESSTSHAHPDVAFLDNAIENRMLGSILSKYAKEEGRRCLDVGAGYGRFTPTFRRYYEQVILLEGASSIYDRLYDLWGRTPGVKCVSDTFEDFTDRNQHAYDLLFASGVLYLYDDAMVRRFMSDARRIGSQQQLLILRDFIAEPARTMESAYVRGGHCYYRSRDFWKRVASDCGFALLEVVRSKPKLALIRHPRFLRAAEALGLSRAFRSNTAANLSYRWGDWGLQPRAIETAYIVVEAVSQR